jgi:uncharacterized protein YgfB (UPF0149 family)
LADQPLLAFRLYGRFQWPPVGPPAAQQAVPTGQEVAGVVDIFFAKLTEADPQSRALLLWRTRKEFEKNREDSPALPSLDDNIFHLTSGTLKQKFGPVDAPADAVCLWAFYDSAKQDPTPQPGKEIRLTFSGASLFQELAHSTDMGPGSSDPRTEILWPLVRNCQYEKGGALFSSRLLIGQPKNDNFRFDLQLPTPFRQTNSLDPNALDPAVFPFAAIYQPKADPGAITLVDAIVVGRSSPGPNYSCDIQGRSLRSLGFSGGNATTRGTRHFLGFPAGELDPSHFWPTTGRYFGESVLSRVGFEVDSSTAGSRLKVERVDAAGLSIWLPQTAEPNSGSMVYRVTVTPVTDGYIGSEDIFAWKRSPGVNKYVFLLNMDEELGGKLRIDSDRLTIEFILSWSISDVWLPDKWNFRLALYMHWEETILAGPLAQQASIDTDRREYFRRGTLLDAAATVEEAQDGLRSVEGSAPFSALPVLSLDRNARVRFILAAPEIPVSLDPTGMIKQEASGERKTLRLTLATAYDHDFERLGLFADESSAPIQARATFPGMLRDPLTGAQSPDWLPIWIMADPPWIDPPWIAAGQDENAERFFASFQLAWNSHIPAAKFSWRLSSLTFSAANPTQLPNKIAGNPDTSQYLRCGGPGIVVPAPNAPVFARRETPTRPTALKFQMLFAVGGISPSNVDVARFDRGRRVDPLLIGTSEDTDAQQPFWFCVTEQVAPTLDRLLTADIYRSVQSVAGSSGYVLLSEEPFSVLRFKTASLASRSDEGSAAVATYSSDDRLWKLKQVADRYHYVLPPQVVGESADKPRRLEIFDLPDVLPAGDDGHSPFRPYDDAPGDGANAQDWGDLHRRAIEFRLAPSTEIWLRPSDVQRSFYMAEWDADRLFRQRGELGLGAALGEFRGEFLYGLSVGIDVSLERGVARQARVAELEALTGRVVGAPTNDTEHPLARKWTALAAAIARRPQRLEVWANDPASPVPFAPARFADGVNFALRETALLRAPVAGTVKPTITGKEFEDLKRGDLTQNPRGIRLRYHPQGLAGGAVWPVESGNLFRALYDNPDSDGGSIESIALSPIGGDASQTAKFLKGRVSIISETHNGFIERQRVEVIGRIGAHWHRAKHVVVYARTTSPSAQFAPKRADDRNQRRSRRPILRKVSEYVELIEWERRYPDFPTATKRHAGFLDTVRFNSRRINVDSAWSSDVGKDGWQIPLWNRASARERPQVYPMPDIAFVTAAEGDGDNPVVAQECLDPDKLYFFASFNDADTDDTNTWAPRLTIDYLNLPSAATLAGIADAKSARDPDSTSRRPSVARVLPGASRFTWRLAPAARKTALNAGRASKPVYVGLNSVTFMRSAGQKDALVDGLGDVLTKSSAVDPFAKDSNGNDIYQAINNLEYWGSDGRGGPKDAGQFKDAVATLCKANPGSARKAADDLLKKWSDITGNVQAKLKPAADAAAKIDAGFDKAKDFVGVTEKQCDRLKADAISTLRGKSALVVENIRTWANDADALLHSFNKTTKKDLIDSLKQEIITLVRPIFAETSADAGHVEADVEKARSIVSDVDAEVEAVFDRARTRVAAFSASYDRTKPWSKNRRDDFQAGVYAAIDNISADIQGLIDEARQRFAVEISNAGQAVGGQLSKALQRIAVGKVQALQDLSDLDHLIDNFAPMATISRAFVASGDLNRAILKDIGDARQAIAGATGIDEGTKQRARDCLTAVDDARKNIADAAANLHNRLETIRKAAHETSNIAADDVEEASDLLSKVVQSLDQEVSDFTAATTALVDCNQQELSNRFRAYESQVRDWAREGLDWINRKVTQVGNAIDQTVEIALGEVLYLLDSAKQEVRANVLAAIHQVDALANDLQSALEGVKNALKPDSLAEEVLGMSVIVPALKQVLAPLPDNLDPSQWRQPFLDGLGRLDDEVAALVDHLTEDALSAVGDISKMCSAIGEGADAVLEYFQDIRQDFVKYANDKIDNAKSYLDAAVSKYIDNKDITSLNQMISSAKSFDYAVRGIQNDLGRSVQTARMYGDRVMDSFAKVDLHKPLSAPSNLLKLYSAVTSAPEIAALKSDIDRIRSNFDEASAIIKTTRATALFNHLGDELKALGLSLPFDSIGERILPADLSNFDLAKVFSHFGGANLGGLLNGFKVPSGVADAVRVTHDFDKKLGRAWVQVDIDAPMSGRRTLFSLEVFKADLIDMRLTGTVRLEASKDSETVSETGFGRLAADLDMIAGGQSLVTFQQIALNFSKERGLKVEFDPTRIRLNPGFRFIQDTLSTLFPDDIGGLKVIKKDGLPIGLAHEFSMPPVSLMFGTSGVSNISISNSFRLLAYPDFIISDRFALSRPELPFIFSIFVIGGTGYIQLEAEYQPFDRMLAVTVEAAVGGSASIGFAFGPFSGEIFVALSATITYRKVIGRPGGGLSIGALLVIAGSVSVCGIVTIGIYLVLRITYRDSGQADADGSLSVTITISRFFKISARANVHYKLRGGRSEMTTSTSVSASTADSRVNRLMKARG